MLQHSGKGPAGQSTNPETRRCHCRAGMASMTAARSSIRKGFASQPSNPDLRQFSRVSSKASAVTAMMRTDVSGQFWRTSLTTSMPPCTRAEPRVRVMFLLPCKARPHGS